MLRITENFENNKTVKTQTGLDGSVSKREF